MDAETAVDAAAAGITMAAAMITTAVAATIIADQDVTTSMTTGIGTMTTTEVEIILRPGLEAITPTGTPVDVKSSKESAGTYVSALLRVGIKQGYILCLHAMFILYLQIFHRFLWKLS